MRSYLALLRGVNVGGKQLLSMAELRNNLEIAGLKNVRTYIQSGNVLFSSDETDDDKLAKLIKSAIEHKHKMAVDVAVFSKAEWEKIIYAAPTWWGKRDDWKHNLIVMIKPYDMKAVSASIGPLKKEIESMQPGNGVIYQSMSKELFGRTTTSKLISSPVYKQMTIRNYNTANKLLDLMEND